MTGKNVCSGQSHNVSKGSFFCGGVFLRPALFLESHTAATSRNTYYQLCQKYTSICPIDHPETSANTEQSTINQHYSLKRFLSRYNMRTSELATHLFSSSIQAEQVHVVSHKGRPDTHSLVNVLSHFFQQMHEMNATDFSLCFSTVESEGSLQL